MRALSLVTIATFVSVAAVGCATAPSPVADTARGLEVPPAHVRPAPASDDTTEAVDAALSSEATAHPASVERLRRELFVMQSDRKLSTIAGRISVLRTRAERLAVPADGEIAQAISDLSQRHALAVEELQRAHRPDDDVADWERSIDATRSDLDVRSAQVALRLAFLAMR